MNELNSTCVTIGFFDSMHLGHQKIIDMVETIAKEKNLAPKVISLFQADYSVITTEIEKQWLLRNSQVDFLSMEFTPQFDIEKILLAANAKTFVIGENFAIGSITVKEIAKICELHAIELVICDVVRTKEGAPISTNLVKEALSNNNLVEFYALCAHHYILIEKIIVGKQIGRTVGMPTANSDFSAQKVLPQFGVYATAFYVDSEKCKGMTNIGTRPTVDSESRISIETFILDFDKMIYGKTCIVEIISFIRGVKKFNGLEEVKLQVQEDIKKAATLVHF